MIKFNPALNTVTKASQVVRTAAAAKANAAGKPAGVAQWRPQGVPAGKGVGKW